MAQNILTDLGEEYVTKNGLDGATVAIGLYNDTTNAIAIDDTADIADIDTEPGNTNYARATVTLSARSEGGNWGGESGTAISFDFSDVVTGDAAAQDVDTAFGVINFTAETTADAGATDHLVFTAALSQTRSTGGVDSIDIAAGALDVNLD